MNHRMVSSFAIRLRDVLSTLESSALLADADNRLRGLGEQLQFACLALPCDEALVALELSALGRLSVPGVATQESWRASDVELLPSGTPFAHLLGGGGGMATQLKEEDAVVEALSGALTVAPCHAMFVPIRMGTSVLGGAALVRVDSGFSDREMAMAERLAEVLSLTLETFQTERVLHRLFATVLPDLCADDAPTGFRDRLAEYIHELRLTPDYHRLLKLAESVGRVAAIGDKETELALQLLSSFERYADSLAAGEAEDGSLAADDMLLDDELFE